MLEDTFSETVKITPLHQQVSLGSLVYSNQLVYAERDPVFSFIIRHYNWTVGVECDVARNETALGRTNSYCTVMCDMSSFFNVSHEFNNSYSHMS